MKKREPKDMRCQKCGTAVEMTGMRHCHNCLKKAFEMVQNPDDWRAPIRAMFEPGDWLKVSALVSEAVEFFTATSLHCGMVDTGYGYKMVVEADGYRNGPAC